MNGIVQLRFPGQYKDEETGWHYNLNRYYDPKIGQYITSDHTGLRSGLNTYIYVLLNPTGYFDLSGLEVRFVCQPLDPSLTVHRHKAGISVYKSATYNTAPIWPCSYEKSALRTVKKWVMEP